MPKKKKGDISRKVPKRKMTPPKKKKAKYPKDTKPRGRY